MTGNFRYPNINGATAREQIDQIRSYLFQLVTELNFMISTIGATPDAEASASYVATADFQRYQEEVATKMNRLQRSIEELKQAIGATQDTGGE